MGVSEGLRSTDGVLDRIIFGPVSTGFSIHPAAGFSFFPLFFFFFLPPPPPPGSLLCEILQAQETHVHTFPPFLTTSWVCVFASAYVRM